MEDGTLPSMSDMLSGRGGADEAAQPAEQPKKKCKPKLGGFLKKALGAGDAC